jgi:N-acetylmuramoyl-L-alanine amidase
MIRHAPAGIAVSDLGRSQSRARLALARPLLSIALALAMLCGAFDAADAANCRPKRPRPPIVLKSMGPCEFNPETASFRGEPAEQLQCLLRPMDRSRNLAPMRDGVPAAFAERAGQTTGLPAREALLTLLSRLDLETDFGTYLWQPVARARDNDPEAPPARYLVIHDTSGPNYGRRPWPANIDEHPRINNLRNFRCSDGWGVGHVVINRRGQMLLTHELGVPWRATKFERARSFGTSLKGLFLHVELIQPRRAAPGRGRRNDALAPTPGFSPAQYDRLALVYTIASVRAERWLIPAFHAPIDAGIRGGHDDPQNFDLDAFAASLEALLTRLAPTDDSVVEAKR